MASDINNLECSLMQKFGPQIRGLYHRYRDVYSDEADILSDSYQIIHKAAKEYDLCRDIPLEPFIYSRLKWGVYSIARTKRKDLSRFVPFEDYYVPGGWDSYHVFDIDERNEFAISALQHLSERQQMLLKLRYVDEWPYSDIAVRMEIKEATVRSLVRHALQNIRKRVRSFDDQYLK